MRVDLDDLGAGEAGEDLPPAGESRPRARRRPGRPPGGAARRSGRASRCGDTLFNTRRQRDRFQRREVWAAQDHPVPTPYAPFPTTGPARWRSRPIPTTSSTAPPARSPPGPARRTVTYLLVTRGEAGIDSIAPAECGPMREAEERAAARSGVDVVEFLDYPDGVIEYGPTLRRDIAARSAGTGPTGVSEPHETWPGGAWNTPDHRAVGRAAIDATATPATAGSFPTEQGLAPWKGVRLGRGARVAERRARTSTSVPRSTGPSPRCRRTPRTWETLGGAHGRPRGLPARRGRARPATHLPGAALAAAFELIPTA